MNSVTIVFPNFHTYGVHPRLLSHYFYKFVTKVLPRTGIDLPKRLFAPAKADAKPK